MTLPTTSPYPERLETVAQAIRLALHEDYSHLSERDMARDIADRVLVALDEGADAEPVRIKTEVTFTYKNHRGETSVRLVKPIMIAFGANNFHPDPQWLLHAWDLHKGAERTFAIKDIRDWDAMA